MKITFEKGDYFYTEKSSAWGIVTGEYMSDNPNEIVLLYEIVGPKSWRVTKGLGVPEDAAPIADFNKLPVELRLALSSMKLAVTPFHELSGDSGSDNPESVHMAVS